MSTFPSFIRPQLAAKTAALRAFRGMGWRKSDRLVVPGRQSWSCAQRTTVTRQRDHYRCVYRQASFAGKPATMPTQPLSNSGRGRPRVGPLRTPRR